MTRRPRGRAPRVSVVIWTLALATACSGSVASEGDVAWENSDGETPAGQSNSSPADNLPPVAGQPTTGPGGSAQVCQTPNPGTAPLRRLSNAEYRNTLQDVFDEVPDIQVLVDRATAEFPSEPESLGFRNSAEFLTVQPLLAQNYMEAAEVIAREVATSGLLSCDSAAQRECGLEHISSLGERLYRRALTTDEMARYEGVLDAALSEYGFDVAMEWVVFTMLQSPRFLYRVEAGVASEDSVAARLAPDELATRLAYMYWQSTPDKALMERVRAIDSQNPRAIEGLVREMLTDARASRLFQFFREWLDLDHLSEFERDPEVFPDLDEDIHHWFQEETRVFVADLLTREDGSLTELLTAPYTYVNGGLSRHYGLGDVTGDTFQRVDSPERSGVLTQATLLSHDKPYRTSIVRRGLKIRTDFLCQNIPAPPNDVPLTLGTVGETVTQRERLEQHLTDENCAGCHLALDTIGVVFENFDAVGRYRTLDEGGETIDVASRLLGTRDADGPIANVRELGARLAASQDVRECYVKQTFRFFFGREVEAADACSLMRMQQAFENSDHNLTELLVSLAQADAFLYRPNLEIQP